MVVQAAVRRFLALRRYQHRGAINQPINAGTPLSLQLVKKLVKLQDDKRTLRKSIDFDLVAGAEASAKIELVSTCG